MSTPKPADPGEVVQLQIRMPLKLHDRLRRAAIKERRSMSSQARALIAEGLKPKATLKEIRMEAGRSYTP